MGQPAVAEVWKDDARYVGGQLDQLKVSRHLLLDPSVLDFDGHVFAWGRPSEMSLVNLCKGSASQRYLIKDYTTSLVWIGLTVIDLVNGLS